jgi:beta-1,2-mannobiose phosphorylase / 1,2-beta-oligomannan phosphorylase
MRAHPQVPAEAWGVLNPACARGRDGHLYLFPRIVAEGNYSRIAMARVRFGPDGNPAGVDRITVVLEPEERYERTSLRMGGVEDPRITYVRALDRYVMTYTALSLAGPRVALAISSDLFRWRRLGLARFRTERGVDWEVYHNKDALLFPEVVPDPRGRPALALLHRPMYLVTNADRTVTMRPPSWVEDTRQSIWISYADLNAVRRGSDNLPVFSQHQLLATPEFSWESLKIGGGAPPLLTHLGWLLVYHGVSGELHPVTPEDPNQKHLRYSAGIMVLDWANPRHVLYRSPRPVLEPTTVEEREGIVPNVVFPTGLDPRTPPAPGSRVDVYYGMADTAVGAGYFAIPASLPVP